MIELRDIKKAFGTKVVLNGVTCTIPNGKTTCIIGRSGCGKSVLLKHVVGLLRADSGDVLIDGRELESMTKDDLFSMRQSIGYVFQGAALFDSLSVFENVVIGLVENFKAHMIIIITTCETKRQMIMDVKQLSSSMMDSLSTDELAHIFGFLSPEDIMRSRLNKKMREAAKKTFVPPADFVVDSVRSYNESDDDSAAESAAN